MSVRSFDPVQLGSIEMFCKAAELEGFTAAAQALGVTAPAVSRSIGRLEERLGTRLFLRTTRQIRLTEEGRIYYQQCRQALSQIYEAERAITGGHVEPSGLVRISVPSTYGHYRVLPRLPQFAKKYPKVDVEVNDSNRNIDFIEQGYDLAVRMGEPKDSGLIARKLEDAPLGVFASPAYLKRKGTPKSLEQLNKHNCIPFVLPSTGRNLSWIFCVNGVEQEFHAPARLRIHEDALGCMSYGKAGGGIFQLPRFIAADGVAHGELAEILLEFSGAKRRFSLLYPKNRHLPSKVRVLIDFLLAKN